MSAFALINCRDCSDAQAHGIQHDMQVTTDLLVSTQAGKKLRKLTKHSNAAVAQAAAAAVAAWKMAVTQEAGIAHNGSAAEGRAPACASCCAWLPAEQAFCTGMHDHRCAQRNRHFMHGNAMCMLVAAPCRRLSVDALMLGACRTAEEQQHREAW